MTKRSTKKILKSIRKGSQLGWFRYFLDTLVVIVGILVAFSLNNWKESNTERKHEQKILKIIQSEFIYNKNELKRNIVKAKRIHERADTILHLFKAPKASLNEINLDSILRGFSGYSTFDPSNGALNDLIGSGNLGIIKNDSLRSHLSKWFGELQDVKEDEVRLIQFGDQHFDPYMLKYLVSTDSKFKSNSSLLLEDVEFENIVRHFRSASHYIFEYNYGMLDSEIDAILKLLENEIEE